MQRGAKGYLDLQYTIFAYILVSELSTTHFLAVDCNKMWIH